MVRKQQTLGLKKARKIIGKEEASVSDHQLSEEIRVADTLADIVLDSFMAFSSEQKEKFSKKRR